MNMKLFSRLAGSSRGILRKAVKQLKQVKQQQAPLEPLTKLNSVHGIRPVNVTSSPNDKLTYKSSSNSILANPALLIGRELELLNVFVGYEEANRYTIRNHENVPIGYIAEESVSFKSNILRQLLRTRRAFSADILNTSGEVVLKINRPIRFFLNSTITISDSNDNIIGVCKSDWHPWRRRYDLFLNNKQFARIDSGFLSWDFHSKDSIKDKDLCVINRNFSGFAVEIFTDKGMYAVHYDTESVESSGLSLDQRAVLLAAAVTIDIDYFSRSSGNGFVPIEFIEMVGDSGAVSDGTHAAGVFGRVGGNKADLPGAVSDGTDAAGVFGRVGGTEADLPGAGGFFEDEEDYESNPNHVQNNNWGPSEFVDDVYNGGSNGDSDGDSWWGGLFDDN